MKVNGRPDTLAELPCRKCDLYAFNRKSVCTTRGIEKLLVPACKRTKIPRFSALSLISKPAEIFRFLILRLAHAGIFSNFLCGYRYSTNKEQLQRQQLCPRQTGLRRGHWWNNGIPPMLGIEVQSFIPWPITIFVTTQLASLKLVYRPMFHSTEGKLNATENSERYVSLQ
jgi:hypothetical protein